MSDTPEMHVLIVGIDEWISPKVPNLKGCCNDVRLMENVFRERFAVPDENIRVMRNEQATRLALETAFREHLIDRARAWKESDASGPEPAFVFHYSGHGSRAIDHSGTQSDGMDETLVPHDSRVGDVYDIKDWEIAQWLDELTSHSDNVTIILDCCHSGSGTRDTEVIGTARECPVDERPQPTKRPSKSPEAKELETPILATTRSTNETDSGSNLPYLLLAACRNDEYAEEYPVAMAVDELKDGMVIDSDNPNVAKHGAFSWFLANELMSLPDGKEMLYRDLFERVRYEVHRKYRRQMPQVRGDQDRVLFGGARVVRDPLLAVTEIKDGDYFVDAGILHGLTTQSELRVYPPETRTLADAPDPIAILQIKELKPTRCRCRPKDPATILLHSRVELPPPFSDQAPKVVSIEIENTVISNEVKSGLARSVAAPYIELVTNVDGQSIPGDFRITYDQDRLHLRNVEGRVLAEPEEGIDPSRLGHHLKTICTYQNALDLRNHSAGSAIRGSVKATFWLLDLESDGDTASDGAQTQRNVPNVKPIPTTADGVPILEMEKEIAIQVTNNSQKKLYCKASSFGHRFEIVPLDGATDEKAIAPGGSKWFGREWDSDMHIVFGFPEYDDEDYERLEQESFTEAREFLKVIASEDEDTVPSLEQEGLKPPFTNYEDDISEGTRALRVGKKKTDVNDWTTVEYEYLVVAPQKNNTRAVSAGETLDTPQYELTVHVPDGFQGQVGVTTPVQNLRLTPPGEPARPGGLIWQSEFTKAIDLEPKRAISPPGDAVLVTADPASLQTINSENPMVLSVDHSDQGSKIAVVWDGACCYPVGLSSSAELPITWMPVGDSLLEDGDESVGGDGSKRGLLRTAKLYLYSLADLSAPDLGLHQSRFVANHEKEGVELEAGERIIPQPGGEVRMRKIKSALDLDGKRCALIVHGFSSDGHTSLGHLTNALDNSLNEYDIVLTFDYESFRTPLSESGRILFDALTAAGMSVQDGAQLDVIATGMGAMVARSMIEQHGGHAFVDQCCLCGPPNGGSQLLKYAQAIPWISTAVVNSAGPNIVSMFLSAAIKKLTNDAVALMDLKPDSELVRSLQTGSGRVRVPYCVLAGEFQVSQTASAWYRAAAGLADFGLDQFFGDQHDLIVDTASMTGIDRQGVEIKQVSANHFEYFQSSDVAREISDWIRRT